ncbi:phosphatidylinositol-specific phospholipase C/glycerophosphodiester phosphodiesterase family protein [Paenibacillus sp. CMAA1364]
MKKIIAVLLLIVTTTVLVMFTLKLSNNTMNNSVESEDNFADYTLISHAMGGIYNQPYTNSYEAFIANYEQGNRVFEVDLLLSKDGQVVARHEWSQDMTKTLQQEDKLPEDRQAVQLTSKEFKESPILGKLTPLDWGDILNLLEDYPDIYIVTDTKVEDQAKIFNLMVSEARERNPNLLNRIVPQIYNQQMLPMVMSTYDFPVIIYTLYASKDTDEEVIDFVQRNHIAAVTMPEHRVKTNFVNNLNNAGVLTYVHTINDVALMNKYEKMGIDGFYTDDITRMVLDSKNQKRWFVLGSR